MMLTMRRIVAAPPLAVLVTLVSAHLPLSLAGCQEGDPGPKGLTLRVVTFNTGSGGPTGVSPSRELTSALKTTCDEHYGNALAWIPALEATARFLADLRPDVVAFQEIF